MQWFMAFKKNRENMWTIWGGYNSTPFNSPYTSPESLILTSDNLIAEAFSCSVLLYFE
jgi:hypothetical protein